MKKNRAAKDLTVTGYVTATERDGDGEASAGVIFTDKENYIIEPNRLGRELLDMEGEEVEIKGRLVVDNDGNQRISVRAYDFIDDTYDEEDDLDYEDEDEDYDEDEDNFDYDDDEEDEE
jgi:hypothetical protein